MIYIHYGALFPLYSFMNHPTSYDSSDNTTFEIMEESNQQHPDASFAARRTLFLLLQLAKSLNTSAKSHTLSNLQQLLTVSPLHILFSNMALGLAGTQPRLAQHVVFLTLLRCG